jgi:hypothetical protein
MSVWMLSYFLWAGGVVTALDMDLGYVQFFILRDVAMTLWRAADHRGDLVQDNC